MLRKKRNELCLLRQGVNGIAQMYAELSHTLQAVQEDLAAQGAKVRTMREQLDGLEQATRDGAQALQQQSEALCAVQDRIEAMARRVQEADDAAAARYYTRGVLDEYMYGTAKEGKV